MVDTQRCGYAQIQGPISKDVELLAELGKQLFENNELPPNLHIEHIGIQSPFNHFCEINGEKFKIGKTGILEIRNVNITSFKFSQDENEETIIDCFLAW